MQFTKAMVMQGILQAANFIFQAKIITNVKRPSTNA
jgi:hypothetical protein